LPEVPFNRDNLLISSAKQSSAAYRLIVSATSKPLARVIKPWRYRSGYCGGSFHDAEADGMQKENNGPTFEGLNAPTLFREFAAECMQLAQTTAKSEKRALYLKMASVWHQMAQRWENKS